MALGFGEIVTHNNLLIMHREFVLHMLLGIKLVAFIK